MRQYIELVKHVLINGNKKVDRTGVGTLSCFGYQNRYDLRKGFPIVTTKKIIFESVVRELIWLLNGSTNINDLHPCKIWDEWADENGNLGPIYGKQWRDWEGRIEEVDEEITIRQDVDQIASVIHSIKNNPSSRRHIVSAWNVTDIDYMALPPCHCFFQFNVVDNYLDCQLYQRSADIALGVPFNIASYSLLTHLIALECNLKPRYFVHTFGDVHIYLNHIEGLKEQISREAFKLPELKINKKPMFSDNDKVNYKVDDIELVNYKHHQFIKFEVAV